jgi:hypothetical protein
MARLESSRGYGVPVLKSIGAHFFPSLCTVKSRSVTQSGSGQPVATYATSLVNHVNLPCRLAPYIKERPVSGEERRSTGTFVTDTFHCLLFGYQPLITEEMHAVIDSVEYGILAVQHDGGLAMTRLRVEKIRPT